MLFGAFLLLFVTMSLNVEVWSLDAEKRSLISSFRGIARSYVPRPFLPVFPSNEHFHTIVGSGVVKEFVLGPPKRNFETIEERVATPDKDFFIIEVGQTNLDSDALVLILHGLESNTKAPLVTNMASAMHSYGFQTIIVGFRGCGGIDNLTCKAYNLGFTDDLHLLVDKLVKRYPYKKMYVSGFSLGGNVALKFLGELGHDALKKNVYGGSVCCVPFDPVASQDKLAKGFNKAVYAGSLLRTLKMKAEQKIKEFPGTFDIEEIRRCETIGDFDTAFIVPLYGYRDKIDYYRKTGAKWWLPSIKVPAISVNAVDDPFIDAPSLPKDEDLPDDCPVKLCYTEHGGHCGFMARGKEKEHGWLAEEVARAMSHIHSQIRNELDGARMLTHL